VVELRFDPTSLDEAASALQPSSALLLRQFFSDAQKAYTQLQAKRSKDSWEPINGPSPSDLLPLASLRDSVLESVQELESAQDSQAGRALREERQEPEGGKWVADNRLRLEEHVGRLGRIRDLNQAISQTNTQSVTLLSHSLTEKFVTKELIEQFSAKLWRVTTRPPPVRLVDDRGEKGAAFVRLAIEGGIGSPDPNSVLSAGERRAAALAAFLAKATLADPPQTLILDDPVSSLDAEARARLATCLAELAKDRQVIVFTHDVPFFIAVFEAARRDKRCPHRAWSLSKIGGVTGIQEDDGPWAAAGVGRRLEQLRQRCDLARGLLKAGDFPALRDQCLSMCAYMRTTIERTVEEVFLGEIVVRNRESVQVSNVRRIAEIPASYCDRLVLLFNDYSPYLHDQQPETAVEPLPLEKIEADIAELASLTDGVRQSRKAH